jgi:hypothetical protein
LQPLLSQVNKNSAKDPAIYGKNIKGQYYKYTGISHLDSALHYIGVRETSNNWGKYIKDWLRERGIRSAANWCASFVSSMLDKGGSESPTVRSALAKKFITKASIPAKDVLLGIYSPPIGSVTIWSHGDSWRGHIGFSLTQWINGKAQTVEGNANNQVKQCSRKIEPYNEFRIVYFTEVKYEKKYSYSKYSPYIDNLRPIISLW